MESSPNSLADQAYEAVREEILRGRLRPGARASRRRLAEELGMSILPVAEALRRPRTIASSSRPRAGTRVRVHTAEDVRELHELRAARKRSPRACSRSASAAQRQELRRLAEQLDVLFRASRAAATPSSATRCTRTTSSSTCGSPNTRAARW
jgi:DNA-binding GntR family transcriptional regulator